jgi:D-serine deaminase-like pyridoxal phosphate-dependent protein
VTFDIQRWAAIAGALREEGPGHPVMVVDLDALDHNCDVIVSKLGHGKSLRLVAKSLPSLPLLDYVRRRTGARGQMVFHAPFIAPTLAADREAELLVGKPMPVRAAHGVLAEQPDEAARRDVASRVIWLVDTPARLAQYAELARTFAVRLRVALEIEIGMHRGGFAPAQLDAALDALFATGGALELAGLMGYDAHVGSVPRLLQDPDAAHRSACATYDVAIERVRARKLDRPLIFNGAGSRTFHRHREDSPLTEVAIGSAFVMPARFDDPVRADLVPAAMIATPVLRAWDGTTLPGLAATRAWLPRLAARFERSYFVYGGRWDGVFAWPPGLVENRLYGGSYNQTLVNGPRAHAVEVDDYVLLRPNDSESVMLQFGDLWVTRGGRLYARWPVLPSTTAGSTASPSRSGTAS